MRKLVCEFKVRGWSTNLCKLVYAFEVRMVGFI